MAARAVPAGLLAVYKPRGEGSAAVVNAVKAAFREGKRLKVGHGGTLDREARGVLVIGVGEGCRDLGMFLACDKEYAVEGCLGVATTTDDVSGERVAERPFGHVTKELLLGELARFKGPIRQAPPVFSAIKRGGVRLSDAARRGDAVDIESAARTVVIHSAVCTYFEPPIFRLAITCGAGTYVRSIVRDLGERVGSVAHVTDLERTRQGRFSLADALPRERWTMPELLAALAGRR